MNKYLKVFMIFSISTAVLFACSNNQGSNDSSVNETSSENNDTDNEKNDNEVIDESPEGEDDNQPESSGLTDRNDSDDDESDDNQSDPSPNLGEGETEDQLDLSIGDKGMIETTIAKFNITLNSASIEKNIGNENPERENFVLVNITLENLTDSEIEIRDSLDVLELTGDLEGSGGPDFSHLSDEIQTMEGTLGANEMVDGELLFEADDFDTFYIRVREGLVSSSAVKNQAIWSFKEEDTK